MPFDYTILRARQPLGTAGPLDHAVDVTVKVDRWLAADVVDFLLATARTGGLVGPTGPDDIGSGEVMAP